MQPQARVRLTNYPYSALSHLTYNKGELVYDETNGTIRLLDGTTAGGIPLANQSWTTNAIRQAVSSLVWPVPNTAGDNGPQSIAIGKDAGNISQSTNYAVAIGGLAGYTSQGDNGIAIGNTAGYSNQSSGALALGNSAGSLAQGVNAIAIGVTAAVNSQGQNSVAIGNGAGSFQQGQTSISIGQQAGGEIQGTSSVAIGYNAGYLTQGNNSVAIGNSAGIYYQGIYSIAIGYNAGYSNQPARTIILNASSTSLSGVTNQTNSFYVNPIRSDNTSTTNILYYNTTTNEITYTPFPTSGVTAGTYSGITVNSYGIVTSATALTAAASLTSFGTSSVNTTANGNLIVSGNLTVNGTVTTVNSTTVNTAEKVLVISSGATTDAQANASGIQVNGTTTKTLEWLTSNSAWNSSENFNIATGKAYEINSTSVLTATTLGSTVVNSSLTSVGTIGTGVWQGSIVQPAYGGTGASTLAGANIPVTTVANTFTGTQSFAGTNAVLSSVFTNTAEVVNVTGVVVPTAVNYYTANQSVLFYNVNATQTWTINFAHSSATTLGTALAVGQSITTAVMILQGASGASYYNTAITIDGSSSNVTVYWQGGNAPTGGNASGIDVYNYSIIKTASSPNTYTVLASLSKF